MAFLNTSMSGPGGDNVASGSTLHQEIKDLFRWNPRPLILPKVPKKTYTTKTRPPAFYDKHFDDRLILQHVKCLPSLVQSLATNVDQVLSAALKTLPSKPLPMSAERRDTDAGTFSRTAPDEKAVANYYDKTTAAYCLAIASALVLHPKTSMMSEWVPLLTWTQSVSSTGYAIMNGELQIKAEEDILENHKAALQGMLASMDPEIRQMYGKMKGPPSMSLATWEFKSVTTGSDAVMNAVRNLGKFSWTYCADLDWKIADKHKAQRRKVGQIKVGPDAQKPPWNLNVSSFTSNLEDRCQLFIE